MRRIETVTSSEKAVSYTQYKTYLECPHHWKLTYIDGLRDDSASIETVFGSAVHQVIQEWLPIHFADNKKAKKMDLNVPMKDALITHFKDAIIETEDGGKIFVCDKEVMQEFYEDGCAILEHLQKYANDFFPTKGFELVGCEVAILTNIKPGISFRGYIDIVIHDTKLDQYHIIDLKTSRSGWFDFQKKDIKKINQILLYKQYFGQQFNVPIENIFPKFIILKRKIKLNPDFIIRRLSNFEPSHGTTSMKKANESWDGFINECYDEAGAPKWTTIKTTPSESNCKYCPFKDKEHLCPDSWYMRKSRRTK
jgi:hypothetical protein